MAPPAVNEFIEKFQRTRVVTEGAFE